MGLLSSYLQRKRINLVGDFIEGNVLEVGCGAASTLEKYTEKITSYEGIEIDKQVVEKLQKKYPKSKFYKRDLDIEKIDSGKKYDTIISLAVIEHIFNQKFSFDQLVKHMKKDGKIIVTTPTPIGNDIVHRIGARLGLFDKSHHDDHIVIYNKERFKILAEEMGLKIVHYRKFQLGCNQIVVFKR